MPTLGRILRSLQRLVLENSGKVSNSGLRCASTSVQAKIVEGSNGEKIISSPWGKVSFSNLSVPDYVWDGFETYGDKIALECGVTGRKYTYAEARDASNYVARSLLDMGLREGDVIALVTPNLPETAVACLGILEAGLVVTTVNPFYTVDEMSKQLESSNSKAVITASEIAATMAEALKALPFKAPFIVIDDGTLPIPNDSIPFKDLITRGKSLPSINRKIQSNEDIAILPYSSGTTGLPKGVMLSHRNLVANMEMTEQSAGDEFWQPTTDTHQEVVPAFLPFFHIFGLNGIMLPRLSNGAKIVTIPKFLPDTFINVLEKNKATMLVCVPPIILFMSASPAIEKRHVERVRSVFSGAAPLSASDVERFYKKFGIDESVVKFGQGYGLTESSPIAFFEKSGTKFASIGKPASSCEARLVDPTTMEDVSGPGQTGELWIRGPHIMKGYLNNEQATREILLDNGWLKTGDIAYYDEDYDFFITDRLKELIKVKGFQVAPAELEGLLRTHPDIEEAAVIGIPDARCGEVPRAFVLTKKGKTLQEEDVQNFVRGKVSEFKELRGGVSFVDNIPKNASGKILRVKLKTQYLG